MDDDFSPLYKTAAIFYAINKSLFNNALLRPFIEFSRCNR